MKYSFKKTNSFCSGLLIHMEEGPSSGAKWEKSQKIKKYKSKRIPKIVAIEIPIEI